MCVAGAGTLAAENAGGDPVKSIIIQITFPVIVLATWILPSLFLHRYLDRLELQEKYR
jgi:hypothetical protein